MVMSGLVIEVNRATNTGVIEYNARNGKRRQYFFSINECLDLELPRLYSTVTFVRDPDYQMTYVAMLIKRSHVFSNVG